jgi:hypothetical protein
MNTIRNLFRSWNIINCCFVLKGLPLYKKLSLFSILIVSHHPSYTYYLGIFAFNLDFSGCSLGDGGPAGTAPNIFILLFDDYHLSDVIAVT